MPSRPSCGGAVSQYGGKLRGYGVTRDIQPTGAPQSYVVDDAGRWGVTLLGPSTAAAAETVHGALGGTVCPS